ncbi:hypothetical protein BH20ACI1_BH20ACI1_22660 [soil metagenome]
MKKSYMKNFISFFFICSIWIILLVQFSSAQDATENLLEKVEVKFFLNAEPTPESVGFDYRKSYWKVEYELYLTDSLTLEKIGRCERDEDYKLDCILKPPKKVDEEIKKTSIRIAKGKFKKKPLSSESNREVVIPINLSAEVIDIFNKARTSDNNPTFVLFVKGKTFTKVLYEDKFGNEYSNSYRFKYNYSTSIVRPLKFYNKDKTFRDFWNVKTFGLSPTISRAEDCTIRVYPSNF